MNMFKIQQVLNFFFFECVGISEFGHMSTTMESFFPRCVCGYDSTAVSIWVESGLFC